MTKEKIKAMINGHEIAGRLPTFKPELRGKVRTGDKLMTRRVIKDQPRGVVSRCWNVEDNIWAMYVSEETAERTLIFQCRYGEVGDIRVMTEPWAVAECYDSIKPSMLNVGPRNVQYLDDDSKYLGKVRGKTRTSMFMPTTFARTTVKITGIRTEQLQEISAEDCIAEGATIPVSAGGNPLLELTGPYPPVDYLTEQLSTAFALGTYKPEMEPDLLRAYFASLWDSINAKPKPSNRNPYTGAKEKCFVSYPWESVQEVREHKGLNWYVVGNPWNWVITWRLI